MKNSKFLKQFNGLLREVYKLWLSWVEMFNMFKRPPNNKKSKNDWKLLFTSIVLTTVYLILVLWMVKVRW